jgi:hypothetical protein
MKYLMALMLCLSAAAFTSCASQDKAYEVADSSTVLAVDGMT